ITQYVAYSFFSTLHCDTAPIHSFPTRRSSDLQLADDKGGNESARRHVAGIVRLAGSAHLHKEGEIPLAGVAKHKLSQRLQRPLEDRKSTRLNSSHVKISYAVFCLKKNNSCT